MSKKKKPDSSTNAKSSRQKFNHKHILLNNTGMKKDQIRAAQKRAFRAMPVGTPCAMPNEIPSDKLTAIRGLLEMTSQVGTVKKDLCQSSITGQPTLITKDSSVLDPDYGFFSDLDVEQLEQQAACNSTAPAVSAHPFAYSLWPTFPDQLCAGALYYIPPDHRDAYQHTQLYQLTFVSETDSSEDSPTYFYSSNILPCNQPNYYLYLDYSNQPDSYHLNPYIIRTRSTMNLPDTTEQYSGTFFKPAHSTNSAGFNHAAPNSGSNFSTYSLVPTFQGQPYSCVLYPLSPNERDTYYPDIELCQLTLVSEAYSSEGLTYFCSDDILPDKRPEHYLYLDYSGGQNYAYYLSPYIRPMLSTTSSYSGTFFRPASAHSSSSVGLPHQPPSFEVRQGP